jgi:hypothetical protein
LFPKRHQYPKQVESFLHRHFLRRMWTNGWELTVVVDETLGVPVGFMWWLKPAAQLSVWERWISPCRRLFSFSSALQH